MAFRKLHFKNVQGSRSSQTLQAGELAVDESTNQLFIGDQSTAGGNAVVAKVAPAVLMSTNYTAKVGDTIIPTAGSLELTLPSSKSAGDFITIIADNSVVVKDGATTIVTTSAPEIVYVWWSGSAWEYIAK
jgi:hypothetical protein